MSGNAHIKCKECNRCVTCRQIEASGFQRSPNGGNPYVDYITCPREGCDCPASIPQQTARTLDAQVQRALAVIHPAYRTPWLAGVRFAQGYAEHGDNLQRMSDDQLQYETAQESADEFNYNTEQAARKAGKQ